MEMQELDSQIGVTSRLHSLRPLSGKMTKLEDWPLWLQMLVGLPHAILAITLVWFWTPTGKQGWYWAVGLFAYLWLFYVAFVR